MSLLHDVLRDLERRDALPENIPSPSGERRRPMPRRAIPWTLVGLATAMLLAAAVAWQVGGTPALEPDRTDPAPPAADPLVGTAAPVPGPAPFDVTAEPPSDAASRNLPAEESRPLATGAVAAPSEPQAVESATGGPENTDAEAVSSPSASDAEVEADPIPARPGDAVLPASATPREDETQMAGPTAEASTEPRVFIRRSDGAPAERSLVDRARLALGRGRPDRARSLLQAAIAGPGPAVEERLLLARLLDASGSRHEARAVLVEGLEVAGPHPELSAALGRMLLASGRPASAIEALSRHAPPAAQAPDAQLLLAAALRQAGRHAEALDRYAAVVAAHPGSGRGWLGHALSLESLERPGEALDSYRQARRTGDAETATFAQHRLAALATDHSAENDDD